MFTSQNYAKETRKRGESHFRCTKGYALSLVWLKKKRQWEDILRICNPATCEPPASCFRRGQSKGTERTSLFALNDCVPPAASIGAYASTLGRGSKTGKTASASVE
ncbi:unnamed protein product [Ixodes pacificus]